MAHAGADPNNEMIYVLSAAIRILHANIHDLVFQNKTVKDVGEGAVSTFANLRSVLLNLIHNPSASGATQHIQHEACKVVALGFELFFAPHEQIDFLVDLLLKAKTSSSDRLLLSKLLNQLLEWNHMMDTLLERDPSQTEDKMEVDSTAKPTSPVPNTPPITSQPKRVNAYRLLVALVNHVFDETKTSIDQIAADTASATVHSASLAVISPAIRLLLALQRALVVDSIYEPLLAQYATELLTSSISMFDYANTQCAEILPNDRLENTLRNSLPGILLSALVTALSGTQFNSAPFPSNNLALLLRAVQSADRLIHRLPDAVAADERYVRRQRTDTDRRVVVETTHPYPHGPNQIKQTITLPGAKSLLLVFDPRSRTVNSSSDILQLFHSSALTDAPIINPRDNSPYLAGTNWPQQMAIEGDSVTFVFSANSRAEKNNSASATAQRWGFRCVVTDLHARVVEPLNHWLLDLENTLVHLTSKCIAALVEGVKVTDHEHNALPWIEDELLWGGLESLPLDQFLLDMTEEKGSADLLYRWMQKQTKGRPIISPIAAKYVDSAERLVISAILKHLGLCVEV